MNVVGIIPARGGSKGVEGKNTALVGGRPLVEWTCIAALESDRLRRVVGTTDSQEIADVLRKCGIEVPFMRPAELARDDTPILPVLHHALQQLARSGDRPDAVTLLQPTSPLRRGRHIDAAIAALGDTGADSVVSVVEVPHRFGPSSLLRLVGERLEPYEDGSQPLRRQDKPVLYARNGPAVLVTRTEVLESGSLYGKHVRPLVMTAEESVDVDTPFDLALADWLLAGPSR